MCQHVTAKAQKPGGAHLPVQSQRSAPQSRDGRARRHIQTVATSHANMTVQEDVGAGAWLGGLTDMEGERVRDPDLTIY